MVIPRAGDSLTALQRLWAYITLGATGIVTEEAAPLVGGLMAHDGHLRLLLVGAWITAGTWVADILLYYLGRWRADWIRERWPTLRTVYMSGFSNEHLEAAPEALFVPKPFNRAALVNKVREALSWAER